VCARSSRNVKRWQSREMCLRWTAVGMLEAERQFRRIVGHADLAKLALAVEREVTQPPVTHASQETATLATH
jgi:putative transposase